MSEPRPLRADAARNRELLLAAAEAEFVERGLDASIADIARRAGVAKGTVFRHFATKEDLIVAIVGDHFAALTTEARRLLDAEDPGAALLEFLLFAGQGLHEHDLTVLQPAAEADPRVVELREQVHAGVEALADRARAAGAIRPEITGTDVFLLMCAPVHAVGFLADPPPDLWRRYVAVIFDGFRPHGAAPLPGPVPVWG